MTDSFYRRALSFTNARLWQLVHIDVLLMGSLLLLIGGGLFILYSASGQDVAMVERQVFRLVIGLLICVALAQLPPKYMRRASPALFIFITVLLVGVLLFGVGAKGAQRWLALPGGLRFQPSEIMKIVMPMMIAWYFSDRQLPPNFKQILAVLGLIVLPVLMIAKQPDLGTALLVAVSGIFVLFLAGLGWRYILGAAALAPIAGYALWQFMHDYQRQRVLTFLDPESDPLGSGWNIIQSKTAIGAGGLTGKGYLEGTQSHLHFLPEGHTDFIIAAFSEEFGLLGVILLMFIYACLLMRALYIAFSHPDVYSRLLAGALAMSFFVYIFVNVGMVGGILPVVGVPLPFISYGGTAIVTLMAGFGLLMSIHTHKSS